jgi:hypothetical protein
LIDWLCYIGLNILVLLMIIIGCPHLRRKEKQTSCEKTNREIDIRWQFAYIPFAIQAAGVDQIAMTGRPVIVGWHR